MLESFGLQLLDEKDQICPERVNRAYHVAHVFLFTLKLTGKSCEKELWTVVK